MCRSQSVGIPSDAHFLKYFPSFHSLEGTESKNVFASKTYRYISCGLNEKGRNYIKINSSLS